MIGLASVVTYLLCTNPTTAQLDLTVSMTVKPGSKEAVLIRARLGDSRTATWKGEQIPRELGGTEMVVEFAAEPEQKPIQSFALTIGRAYEILVIDGAEEMFLRAYFSEAGIDDQRGHISDVERLGEYVRFGGLPPWAIARGFAMTTKRNAVATYDMRKGGRRTTLFKGADEDKDRSSEPTMPASTASVRTSLDRVCAIYASAMQRLPNAQDAHSELERNACKGAHSFRGGRKR